MKKILVAVDGSEPALKAAQLALELASAMGAKLTAVYSVAPMLMPGEVPFTVVNQVLAAEVARGKLVLTEVKDKLGNPIMGLEEVQGNVAESIARFAEEEDFDLVVVGSRGRGAVARVLLGSVADRLVHICKKPVLVAR